MASVEEEGSMEVGEREAGKEVVEEVVVVDGQWSHDVVLPQSSADPIELVVAVVAS